jgi:amino-acid N-acetyltransferase
LSRQLTDARVTDARVTVRAAREADLPAVLALLAAANLPLDGVGPALRHGVVAEARGVVVGAAAVEPYGPDGLVRSVVVDAGRRGTGVGRAVVAAAEEVAAGLGLRDLYLLTETAPEWFPRLRYVALDRIEAPPGIAGSWEFQHACADRGILMRRTLGMR